MQAPQDAAPREPRPSRTRSRIGAACARCQKRKIRCDNLLPACGACQKAGVQCLGGGGSSREIPRSYVNDLESRIAWLESIIREQLPEIDLMTGPGRRPGSARQAQTPCSDPAPPREEDAAQQEGSLRQISDQIGLVSVTAGTDLRYLGPSSGLFFTRFVLAGLGKKIRIEQPAAESTDAGISVPPGLLAAQPKELPQDQTHARWLSQAYFDSVHLQFPFLHEPTHQETIQKMYGGVEVGAVGEFQVFMVLAVGATILSRRAKVLLSAEGYCASAMEQLERVVQEMSLGGVQCVLLLQMYTLNNPSSGLSLWLLHYHGLAMTIELGLQRNAPSSAYPAFEAQMRTRAFWCCYAVDRLLSTLMGRPIGVMDEQCDMRYPLDVNDGDLEPQPTLAQPRERQDGEPLTSMSTAIHLFKLARLNTEIKCVLYCVDRQYPPYTQPAILDVVHWKADMLQRLEAWKTGIPRDDAPSGRRYAHLPLLCEIKYHEMAMLVLRPSPLFPQPDRDALRACFASAMACTRLYHRLYTTQALHYGWIGVHSLFVSVMTMFYCVRKDVVESQELDRLLGALKASSDVLSAMGEYWPEATRSRNVLDRVSAAAVRRLTQKLSAEGEGSSSSSSSSLKPPEATSTGAGMLSAPFDAAPIPTFGEDMLGDPSSSDASLLTLKGGNMDDPLAPLYYGDQTDSFASAEVLSYFLGSGSDSMTGPVNYWASGL